MSGRGDRNILILVACVGLGLSAFYGFLAYRAWLWTPSLAVFPTTKVFTEPPAAESPPDDSAVDRGRRLYARLGCAVCHGLEGRGGARNPNAKPDQKMPDLQDLSDAYTPDDLRAKISDGSHVWKKKKDGLDPIDMPSWNKLLDKSAMDDLCRYLLTLKAAKTK